MKRKSLWVGVGLCLLLMASMIPALTLTSCTKSSSTTTTTVTTTTNANTPVLGGTLTYYGQYSNGDPPSWDCVTTNGIANTMWENPYQQTLLTGDINKYGPRGTDAFSFQYALASEFGQYYGPNLATSWTMTTNPLGVIYEIRPNVMWTGNTTIGMAARALTANDVAYSLNRDLTDSPIKGLYDSYVQSITATGPLEVTIVWSSFYSQWESPVGLDGGVQAFIIPQEEVTAGANNWHNQVGTGPFILTNFVSGSSATYTKNPAYWGTTTINGKTYQEPLINTFVYPIIADQSTALAALRTGKIDMWAQVPITYASSLTSSSPNLIQTQWLSCRQDDLHFNCIGNSVFNSEAVRRAMYVATDLQTIANDVYSGGVVYSWPIAPGVPEFTPENQLPAQDQLLFNYNVATAKQMLAAAGYPNGFSCEITINSSTTTYGDTAAILVQDWALVGVTLTIQQLPDASYQSAYSGVTYADTVMETYSTDDAWAPLYSDAQGSEGCSTNDPTYNAMYSAAQATQDTTSRVAQKKAMGVYILDQAYQIGFANPYVLNCYWPWVKNYYGEISAGNYTDIMPMVTQLWIDQTAQAAGQQ